MARNVLGVLVGIVFAAIATAAVQSINWSLFPFPEGLQMDDTEGMQSYMDALPIGAYIVVLVAHAVGACVGAFVCSIIADTYQKKLSLAIGVFMLFMGLGNLLSLPHPIWFNIVDVMVYLPAAFLGYRLYVKYWLPRQAQ